MDLTDMRGAMCARVLGDLGADVIRVERPGTPAGSTQSLTHRYRNANKRGVVLDPSSPGGRARLDALLANADVLVENVDRQERCALGLTEGLLGELHPALVHVALADLGLSGPRSDWLLEALPAHAASGGLHVSGFANLPPCNAPGFFAHDCASVYGALGAVAAVLDRARHGRGQLVEISVQEAAMAATNPWSIAMPSYTKLNPLLPVKGTRNADGNYWVFPAKDGFVRGIIGGGRPWQGFIKLLRTPEELTGPEWTNTMFRLQNSDVIRLIAQDRLSDRTRAELFEEAREYGTALGVMHTVREFVAHEQTVFRGSFVKTGFAGLGGLPFAKNPVNLSVTPTEIHRPAPEPGEDDGGAFQTTVDDVRSTRVGRGEGLLLDGVRVMDFGVAAVVPEFCMALSELGAEVIKIESVAHPDVLRGGGPSLNTAFTFNTENRGRKSVALDLTTPEGRELAMQLCASADIVAENNRGGVMEAFGLGYEDIRARNPGIVYASSQGYGQGGPLGQMPAFGPLNAGFAGLHMIWNHPEAPYPCGTTLAHPDHIAGKLLAASVLAALHHRALTGEGQHLEMAQTETAAYLTGEIYLDAALHDRDPAPVGNRHPDAVPHGVYPTAGDDRWVAIAVMDDERWQLLCKALGWDLDPALGTLPGRLAVQDRIDERLSEWTRTTTCEDAAALLQANGVSAMPVMGPLDHFADPHLDERGFIDHLVHAELGEEQQVRNPIRMSRLRQRTAKASPCLGADTESVLGDILGYSAEEVAELRDRGVCR